MTECLGVRFVPQSADAILDELEIWGRERRSAAVHFCNAYTLSVAARQQDVLESLQAPGAFNVPDGVPVAWLLKKLGSSATRVVRGPSAMKALIERGLAWRARHVFFGGSDGTIQRLVSRLEEEYPGVNIAAAVAPDYTTDVDLLVTSLREAIAGSQPHYVWIGLGTPKQDLLMAAATGEVDAPLLGVGAAFDFIAGTKREAPEFIRGSGLEWCFRLASEPRRLWRRYLIGNAVFVLGAVRELFRNFRSAGPHA